MFVCGQHGQTMAAHMHSWVLMQSKFYVIVYPKADYKLVKLVASNAIDLMLYLLIMKLYVQRC